MSDTVRLGGEEYPVHLVDTMPAMWDLRSYVETNPDVVWGLDVETTSLNQWDPEFSIRTVQISDGDQVWILMLESSHWVKVETASMLSDKSMRLATHSDFDTVSIWKGLGVAIGNRVVDTLVLASIAFPSEQDARDLKSLTTEILDAPELEEASDLLDVRFREMALERGEKALARTKNKLRGWGFANVSTYDPVFLQYAALDALAVSWLPPALIQEIPRSARNLIGYEMWVNALCTGVKIRGLCVDSEWVEAELDKANLQMKQAQETICRITGLASARSPKRVDWLLAHGVKFDAAARTDTGQPSLAKDHLPPMVEKYGKKGEVGEVIRAIADISEVANRITNLTNYLKFSDSHGLVHPSFNTLRARTARMSITEPALQTITPDLRAGLVAREEHVLVSLDFSQVEARVAAALSGDPVLSGIILSGEDLHDATARSIFGNTFTEKDRATAKIANFQSLFGGGAKALARSTGIKLSAAKDVHDRWNRTYRGVKEFGDALSQRREVVTPTGRVLPVDAEQCYAALNYMIQSTARDLLVISLFNLIEHAGIPEHAVWLLIHDELVLEVPEAHAQSALEVGIETMTFELYGIPIMPSGSILGKRWSK